MAAFYYFKNGGTATGDSGRYATKQTGGLFALATSGYYVDKQTAESAATPPVAGDFVLGSDLSVKPSAGTPSYTGVATTPYFALSVDDANVENARTTGNRCIEASSASSNITFTNQFISGMQFFVGNDNTFNRNNVLMDCTLKAAGPGDIALKVTQDSASLDLINSEIALDNATSTILISNGGCFRMMGGEITSTTVPTNLFSGGFVNGGGHVELNGSNLSVVTDTLFANVGGSFDNDDTIDIKLFNCTINASVDYTNEVFKSYNQRLIAVGCSSSSSARIYSYAARVFGGNVDHDDTIFRNEDVSFEGGQKVSYKIVTNSDVSIGSPLWFDFPAPVWAKLSTATNTARLYLASDTALDDIKIRFESSYPDSVNKQEYKFLSTGPVTVGGTADFMKTGTALTTDVSSTWTNPPSNLYFLDLQLINGSDSKRLIRVYCTEKNITIQVAAQPIMV